MLEITKKVKRAIGGKSISEDEWHFKQSSSVAIGESLDKERDLEQPFETSTATLVAKGTISNTEVEALLSHFGERSYHSKLKLSYQGEEFELELHRRKGIKTFLGMDGDFSEIFIPETVKDHPKIKELFGAQRTIPAEVVNGEDRVTLKAGPLHLTFTKNQPIPS